MIKDFGIGVVWQSLGKYFDIMAVLDIVLQQITNKPNQPCKPNLLSIVYPDLPESHLLLS